MTDVVSVGAEDRCKLYCRVSVSSAYYLLKEKVIDGTVCGPDTYDICVNGICRTAGCDHVLGSVKQLGAFSTLSRYSEFVYDDLEKSQVSYSLLVSFVLRCMLSNYS